MSRFFDPQSGFWQLFAKIADVLMLSILWLFLSLLILPMGAATAGLYDATVKCVLHGENGTLAHFFTVFKREFKTGAAATLLWGGFTALLGWLVWTARGILPFEGATGAAILACWFGVLLVPGGALCWMFPLLSRFTFSVKDLIVTSLHFAVGQFPRTLVMVAATVGAVILSNWLLVPMLILPCLVAMLWAALMEGVFQNYM